MASLAETEAAFLRAHEAGDKAAAGVLAAEVQRLRAEPKEPQEQSKLATLGATLGQGFGEMALGAQDLIGKGISAAGGERAGDWLQKDAAEGRQKLAAEAAPYAEANPVTAAVGRVGGQVAGAYLGGRGLGAGATAVGLPRLGQAIGSGGMTTGAPVASRAADLAIRTAGGAVAGGAGAALADPEQAGTGAAIGAALPGGLKAAGTVGAAAGRVIRGPDQAPELAQAIQSARGAGYVIPPSQARPTLLNRVLEGLSGKITTAQNASAKNAQTTNKLASRALGLPDDTVLSPDLLGQIRGIAGQSYDAIAQTGTVQPGAGYTQALDAIAAPFQKTAAAFPNAKPSPVLDLVDSLRSNAFDAASAVEKIKQLRTASDDAFRTGNTDVGRAARDGAKALEDAIETHLAAAGPSNLLAEFREARTLIAKTYSVEKAMNPSTGAVDARKLASQLQKGKPLSGDLRTAAEFAGRFPKAAQTVEGMGSLPQSSPLDWAVGGGLSAATSNPLMLASIAARPAARSLVLSAPVQNRLVPGGISSLAIPWTPAEALTYRAAPVLAADQ